MDWYSYPYSSKIFLARELYEAKLFNRNIHRKSLISFCVVTLWVDLI